MSYEQGSDQYDEGSQSSIVEAEPEEDNSMTVTRDEMEISIRFIRLEFGPVILSTFMLLPMQRLFLAAS